MNFPPRNGLFPPDDLNGNTFLHFAIERNDVPEINRLLTQEGASPHEPNNLGETPLHYAARVGHELILETLLSFSEERLLNTANHDGWTPAFWAVLKNNIEVLYRLKKAGLDFKHRASKGKTLLHIAAQEGHTHLIHYLIKSGADLKQKDDAHLEAIDYAIQNNNIEMIHALLPYYEQEQYRGCKWLDLLDTAYRSASLESVKVLKNLGWHRSLLTDLDSLSLDQINNHQWLPKAVLCRAKDAIISYFIARSVDLDCKHSLYKKSTALHIAAEFGYEKVAQMLIEAGASVRAINAKGQMPLHYAIANSDAISAILLDYGAPADAQTTDGSEFLPLHYAIRADNTTAIKLLLRHDSSLLEKKDVYRRTPLHAIAARGRLASLKTFLFFGAQENALNIKRETPLFYAAANGNLENIVGLVKIGNASLHAQDYKGDTPLDYACMHGKFDAMLFLFLTLKRQENLSIDQLKAEFDNLNFIRNIRTNTPLDQPLTASLFDCKKTIGRLAFEHRDQLEKRLQEIEPLYNYLENVALVPAVPRAAISPQKASRNIHTYLARREIRGK